MDKVYFVLSVDTEEEWDWTGPFPEKTISVDNVQFVPEFHRRMDVLGVKPSYFLDYAVLEQSRSRDTLGTLLEDFPGVECGAHLHPWVTPPVIPVDSEADSHIVNLPIDVVAEQLHNLTGAITELTRCAPTAFRSGRWGINDAILAELINSGYQVDSSVYPYYQNDWFSCVENSSEPFQSRPANVDRSIIELPVTAGFNRKAFAAANRLHQRLEQAPWSKFHSVGILWALGLLRKLYLSPELASSRDMRRLCAQALANKYPVIHMYLHSSSLLPGSTEYVQTEQDKARLYRRIEDVVGYLRQHREVEVLGITEAALRLKAEGKVAPHG